MRSTPIESEDKEGREGEGGGDTVNLLVEADIVETSSTVVGLVGSVDLDAHLQQEGGSASVPVNLDRVRVEALHQMS